MKKQRRKFTKEFKWKVILDALKERDNIQHLAMNYELHPQQITNCKQDYMEKSLEIMDVKTKSKREHKKAQSSRWP
jgi:transposase-like protein